MDNSSANTRQREYVAFDLEIAKVIPDSVENWSDYRPFGITCAATLSGDEFPRAWHGGGGVGNPADRMSQEETIQLVKYLQEETAAGKTILTWNGAGFDFSVLAEESGMWEECRSLATRHVDMMFHVFCLKGFAIGLDKAARGMSLRSKLEGISGAMAPRLWLEGKRGEVLEYVCQDVTVTLAVCEAVEQRKSLQWVTSRGASQIIPLPKGWLTVEEAQKLPLPDTTWMKNAWPRSKFTGWMEENRV